MEKTFFKEEIHQSDELDEAFNAVLSNWIVGVTFFIILYTVAHFLLSYFYKQEKKYFTI